MPTTAPSPDQVGERPGARTDRAAIRHISGVADVGQAHAVRVGEYVFVSGQMGLNKDGQIVGPDDCHAQAVQCFHNLKAILHAAGAQLSDIVRVVCYLTDRTDAGAYAEARSQFFDQLPATTAVVVKELLLPEALLELDVTAVLSTSDHPA